MGRIFNLRKVKSYGTGHIKYGSWVITRCCSLLLGSSAYRVRGVDRDEEI